MKKTSETIVFFGNERIATGVHTDTPVLRGLLDAGYHIAAVVAHHETTRSRNARSLEIAELAEKHNIPVLLPARPVEILDQLRAYQADAAVLVAYGKIVPQSVIDIFPRGIINIHPSILPKHRGPTPLESVILQGEKRTGVSIMSLSYDMDAGPIYAQSECQLKGDESKQVLANTLLSIGAAMLIDVLPGILDGSVVAMPQDHNAASYDQLLLKQAGILDFRKSALQLEREIRAYQEWPKSRTHLAGVDIVITAAHATTGNSMSAGELRMEGRTELMIGCSDGQLAIDRLTPAGKKEMSTAEFIQGYGAKLTTKGR